MKFRWSLIAGRLPGRTDNEIKNYWNTNIGRKLQNGGAGTTLNTLQQEDQNVKEQEWHYDKGSCLVQTKATTWTNKVTVTNEISRHNEGIIIKSNVIGDNKMKGFLLSPSKESNNDSVLLDFMADFEMDGNFFSELLKMDLPESSCKENKILGDNGNPSTVDKVYLSPKSSCDTAHFPWGDSFYDTNFDFLPVTIFMESGFDWL